MAEGRKCWQDVISWKEGLRDKKLSAGRTGWMHPIWRRMLKMKKKRFVAGTVGFDVRFFEKVARFGSGTGRVLAVVALLTAGSVLSGGPRAEAQTQTKLGPAAPVSYDNKFEVYGGLNFMNFQAGQALPKRMNLGGGEILGTYWLTRTLGLGLEYRGEAGTTPVDSNPYGISRPLVFMNVGMVGAQYRGPKNQHAAVNYHAYGGLANGVFDDGTAGNGVIAGNAVDVGLYSNRTKPIFAVGGSIDFNQSKNFAVRVSPDLIVEHFGTETREFFAISVGVVYRIGKKK